LCRYIEALLAESGFQQDTPKQALAAALAAAPAPAPAPVAVAASVASAASIAAATQGGMVAAGMPSAAAAPRPASLVSLPTPTDPSPPPPPHPLPPSQVHVAPQRTQSQYPQQSQSQPFAAVGAPPSAANKSLEEVQREVREMMEQGKREATRTREYAHDSRPAPAESRAFHGRDEPKAGVIQAGPYDGLPGGYQPSDAEAMDMTHASTYVHAKLAAVNQMAVSAVNTRTQPQQQHEQQQPRDEGISSASSVVGAAGVRAALGTLNLGGLQSQPPAVYGQQPQEQEQQPLGGAGGRAPVPPPLAAAGQRAQATAEQLRGEERAREERAKYGLSVGGGGGNSGSNGGRVGHSRVPDWLHGPHWLSSIGVLTIHPIRVATPGCQIGYMDHTTVINWFCESSNPKPRRRRRCG
jgi:hypothetical protein